MNCVSASVVALQSDGDMILWRDCVCVCRKKKEKKNLKKGRRRQTQGENFRLKPSSHWAPTPSLTLALLLDSGDYSLSKLLIKLMNFPSQNAPDRTERARVCVCFPPSII